MTPGIHVILQGKLTQEPVLDWPQGGVLALELELAVEGAVSPDSSTDLVHVTLFGGEAEALAGTLTAGTLVKAEGRLRLGA